MAITKIQVGAIQDASVTHAKLHTTMDLSSKTVTLPTINALDVTNNISVGGTVDGIDIATRDAILTSTTTTAGAALPKAGGAMTGDVSHGDGVKAKFGAGDDLSIYHNGTDTFLKNNTGQLGILGDAVRIRNSSNSEQLISADANGAVNLYYDNAVKLATTSTGIDVTGTVTADALTASGALDAASAFIGPAGYNVYIRNIGGTNRIDSYNDPITATVPLQLNASQHAFYIADAEKMRIDSSGNVGIGTASPSAGMPLTAYYSTTSQMHLGGAASIVSNNTYYNGSAWVNREATRGGAMIQLTTGGATHFRRAGTGAAPTVSYSMSIDATGKVGIGTTSPAQKLTLASGYVQVGNGVNAAGGVKYPYSVASADCRNWRTRTDIAGYGDWGIEQSTTQSGETYATKLLINPDGIVTTPNQPAFSVWPASSQSNISVNAWTTILFDTEFFDQNQDFSSSTFTAPVTGKYQLNASVRFNVDDGALYYHVQIETSNSSHRTTDHTRNFANADIDYFTQTISVLADMDAGDTAFLKIYQSQGAAITDIDNDTRFSGYLAC